MKVDVEVIEIFGGAAALEARVAAFRAALAAHAQTENVAAPVEHDIVEHIARSGEPMEPFDAQPLALVDAAAEAAADARGYDRLVIAARASGLIEDVIAVDPATPAELRFRPPAGRVAVPIVRPEDRAAARVGGTYDAATRTFAPPPPPPPPAPDPLERLAQIEAALIATAVVTKEEIDQADTGKREP